MVLIKQRSKVNLIRQRPKFNVMPNFDWTREAPSTRDFEKATRENVDWTTSPLGPIAQWPSCLRQMVLVCMADTTPSAVVYGPSAQSAIVYNEAFAELVGKRHPNLQGHLVKDSLIDICPDFDATWKRQTETGRIEILEGQKIRQDRLGFIEEKTYRWKLLPLISDDGFVAGSLITVDEQDKTPPRRERSKSAVREISNAIKTGASQTAVNILKLDEHFSGRTCNCAKLWELQTRLETTEARFEQFGNSAPVGIVALLDGWTIDFANTAYWDVMAQPSDTKSFLDYIHPEDVAKVQEQLELGSFCPGSFTFQCRLKKWAARAAVSPSEAVPEASPAWILVSAFKEQDHDVTMCWIIDITSHKSAEAFLRRRMDEALREKAEKERFIDQISHEVRNPLSAMLHCTDDIISNVRQNSDQSSADVLEAAQTVAFCTHHIKSIIDDVLTLSKLDSRLVEISPVAARPLEVVEKAITIFQREVKANNIEITFVEDPSIHEFGIDWLMMDSVRYIQVLFNMVTNAIKVVKTQPIRSITVKLGAATNSQPAADVKFVTPRQHLKPVDFGDQFRRSDSLFLVTTVEDTGPGLTLGEVSSLFERFAQASPKTESKYGGSGLGLFISRDLTELQGGRIGVASEAGVGSKFVFSVECKRCDAPEMLPPALPILIPARLQGTESAHSPILSLPSEPPHSQETLRVQQTQDEKRGARRVLVVEDNLINQKVLANQLRKRGYEVSTALHGEEALKKLHLPLSKPDPVAIPRKAVAVFDVVLLDIEMPVMDGISCIQHIRAHEAARGGRSRIPVIAVTANARSEHGEIALAAGMDAITTKPYKIEELVLQIEKACNPAG